MKIFKHVLNEATLAKVQEELNFIMDKPVWRVSDQFWGDEIKVGITGVCTSALVSEEVRAMVENCIKAYLPSYQELVVQHYVWHKHSGISTHNDWTFKFGATIYLNLEWNRDFGGVFMWADRETKVLTALNPEYNMMVLNTEKEDHLVTTISPLAPSNRITLQIWGR